MVSVIPIFLLYTGCGSQLSIGHFQISLTSVEKMFGRKKEERNFPEIQHSPQILPFLSNTDCPLGMFCNKAIFFQLLFRQTRFNRAFTTCNTFFSCTVIYLFHSNTFRNNFKMTSRFIKFFNYDD